MACPQKVVIPKGMVGPCETAIVEIPAELKDVDTVVAKPRTPCPAASLPPGARNARSWPPRSGKRRHHFPQPGESFVEGIPCTPEEPSYDESFAAALPTGAANARTWPPRSGKRPQHFPQLGGSFVEGIPCTPEEPSYDESFAAALPTGAANARTWPPRSGKRRHHYPQPGGSFEGVPSTPEESSYDESFQETYDTIYEEVQDLEVCELNTAIARVRSFQAARRGFIAAAACVSTVEDVIRTKGKKFLKSAKKGLQRCRLFPTEKGFYDPSAAAGKPKPGRKKFMPQTGTYPVWQKYDDALTRSPGYTPQKGSYSPWNVAVGDSRYPTKQETNIPSPKRRITPAMYYYNWFPREKGIATPPKRRDMRKLKKYYQGYEDCSLVVTQDIEAVEGKSVSLPCDVTPPNNHDKVYMVFWFQHGSGYPIYSFDVRGKPLSRASHWSAPDLFGSRAYFRTVSEPAQLVIDDIRRHDEGVYRCRVDFRNAQTRSFRYNLTVIVPPEQPTILDKWGRQLNGTVGPHEEGDDITLTCRVVGGHPQPVVRWLINAEMVDDQWEHNAGDVIENRLVKKGITRQDLDAIFTCQAINTVLTEPKVASVVLDLLLRPLTAKILKTVSPLVADKRYEVSCESAGSRPPAIITWYKGKRPLRKSKQETRENVTISELTFIPTTEDDGKSITCRAENPNVTGLFLETSWKIDVVYPPQVSLHLGSTLNADDIKEGDDVYFECRVTANPHWRKLTWLHNGFVLNHNMSGRIIHSNQSLVLQKVTRQSAGRYVCSVVNSEGETLSNELNFRVQYAPTCKFDKFVVVGASRGESVDIVCEVEADPPAKSYRWKFNNSGETLDVAAERFAKTSNGTMSILRYTPVSELDYGSLSCWAINTVGHQVNPCIFQVVAAGKPFPVRNCSLSNQTSSSVEVTCLAGFDGGLPQHFLLELYSANSLVPRYNMTAWRDPEFFLDSLEPDITFRIVVFAVNAKGRSQGVVLEEVTFRDAEKRTASDGDLPFSPVLGVLIGATLTIIIVILLVIIRVRRSQNQPEASIEQKVLGGPHHNTMSSTKPLLRSSSPRDTDEKDPDVIPAKYGSPDGESARNVGTLNGPQSLPLGSLATSPSYAQTTVPAPQWVSPVAPVEPMYHLYNNPVAMVGTFSRDSRPKELRLASAGSTSSLQSATDLELNGLAIKERLMANRLPESCV